jgi:O-antigen/teichoic acid export membrane protein
MGTSLVLRLIAGIFTVIICMLSALIFSPKDVSLILIFVVSLTFIFSSFQLLNYEFQAAVKGKYPSLVSLIVVITLNILKIIVIILGGGVIYLAGILLLEPILYGLGFMYFRIKEFGTIKHWRYENRIAVSVLKDSFPLIFASAFFAVYARIDQVMIKNMIDAKSVGLYSSAVSLSEVWYFIPNMIMSAVFPAIINAKKVSEELYYKRTRKLFLLLIFISFITALPTAFLSKYLITMIYGAGFLGALSVLQIYVWSNIGAALNMLAQQLLIDVIHQSMEQNGLISNDDENIMNNLSPSSKLTKKNIEADQSIEYNSENETYSDYSSERNYSYDNSDIDNDSIKNANIEVVSDKE